MKPYPPSVIHYCNRYSARHEFLMVKFACGTKCEILWEWGEPPVQEWWNKSEPEYISLAELMKHD